MKSLIGKKVSFVPLELLDKLGRDQLEFSRPVDGVVAYVNVENGWFRVAYKAAETIQHECFKFDDLGSAVMIRG